ncbi:MAG: hypothetical protein ACM3ZT_08475 [Bacillota bacterium]
MRIYYSTPDELLLLDSLEGMNALHARLEWFLKTCSIRILLEADQSGTAEPHDELLLGLEIVKTEGPVELTMTPGKWLKLTGSPRNLKRYVSHFHFDRDEDHHHPDHCGDRDYLSPISMSMMVEVSTSWMELHESAATGHESSAAPLEQEAEKSPACPGM